MSKDKSKNNKGKGGAQAAVAVAEKPVVVEAVIVAPVVVAEGVVAPKKKYYYNKEKAKEYRDKIKAAAILGGYVPKERQPGSGQTIKKVSAKSGKSYYYQPWSTLTEEQKKARLTQARDRSARDRADAAAYRAEHAPAETDKPAV